MNTQPEPSPQPSPILWGKKICISILDTSDRTFSITPKDNYYDQLTYPNQQKQTSKKKDGNIKAKNQRKVLLSKPKNQNQLQRIPFKNKSHHFITW